MQTAPTLRNTGPIEARDFGPMGRRLGTFADCYDGSPWELHRGELIEQMGSRDIHGVIMAIVAALFRNHARDGMSVMTDVYCELSDDEGPSLRAPDVVLVRDLVNPRNDVYRGTPVLAVEVRGTQSKRYLEEKVKLYLAHDWPVVWIAHAGRQELEVVRRGMASVTYRLKVEVPLVPELDKYGLRGVPAVAIFDQQEASRVTDQWVHVDGETIGQARGETIGQARGE
ncbi:MAG: Uma2 family endonuclease, partial [Myxococcales bacterium]